ncbi:hypothetical protein [Moorena producens]|uniref:hypothetical protein n=1 Tax=Moorena producens TaxID=1155739 RepID=UPI001E380D8B|nr:hypothetical protein [Moorena producens]
MSLALPIGRRNQDGSAVISERHCFCVVMGSRECGEMGRWGDGEMGRWGDREM